MNFKKGDRVRVISGSNKGKEGTITQILKEENRYGNQRKSTLCGSE